MSFMFNPHPYDDPTAVNRLDVSERTAGMIVSGTKETALALGRAALDRAASNGGSCMIAIDGYLGAHWEAVVNLMAQQCASEGAVFASYDIKALYKEAKELDELFRDYLPEDKEEDPVLLFGKLNRDGRLEDVMDAALLAEFARQLAEGKAPQPGRKQVVLVHGCGAAIEALRPLYDWIAYMDVTPKQAILRAKNGLLTNLGDDTARPFKALLRRAYYIDFELIGHLRGELLRSGAIDYYIASGPDGQLQLLPREAFDELLSSLARTPFRCKPVYIEGVWGGQYVKKLRRLPDSMRNVAWVFDLIPLEVSIVVQTGGKTIEFPYFTFVQKEGEAIMGRSCAETFGGYFPIRFNYDDTYHSNGNMSIQVHPDAAYSKERFNEHGAQDESYYVVATGHGACTYVGFKDDADAGAFMREAKRSEREHTPVNHDAYVHAVPSEPGTQIMLPAGTIHASGRNQVILEIGSLTVGSYTFKLYDYMRADLDGVPRPIHTAHGDKVLRKERNASYVREKLVLPPRPIRSGDGYAEYVVGEHDSLYFSLRKLEFERRAEDDTKGRFHVLALVDGERVRIRSLSHPERSYEQHYLDVVVVPADVGAYEVINLGDQPVVLHKTVLKDGFDAP